MADFEINIQKLNEASNQMGQIQSELYRISSEVGSVFNKTRGVISVRIGAALLRSSTCTNINNCAVDMKNMRKAISDAVYYYRAYEKNVYDKTYGKAVKSRAKNTSSSKKKSLKEKLKDAFNSGVKAIKKGAKKVANKIKKTAKSVWNGIKDGFSKGWNKIKDTAGKIKKGFSDAIDYIKQNYNEHGVFYKIAQYGKAAVSIVGSTAAIAGAVASLIGTGGLSTPAAIATIIYSVNGIANSVTDVVNVANKNYDQVGKTNYLKQGLADAGGWLGGQLGNEQLGEALGTGVYYAGSLYTTFSNLSNSIDKAKQVDSVKLSDAIDSAKKLGAEQISVKELMTTDVNQLRLEMSLLKNSQDYKALFDYADNAKTYISTLGKVVDFTFDTGDAVNEVYNVATGSEGKLGLLEWYSNKTSGNAVSNTYDGISGAVDDTKDIAKALEVICGIKRQAWAH